MKVFDGSIPRTTADWTNWYYSVPFHNRRGRPEEIQEQFVYPELVKKSSRCFPEHIHPYSALNARHPLCSSSNDLSRA